MMSVADDLHQERYLGDGLYAQFDGFTIWLRAQRENDDHFIGLEPEVLKNFEEFVQEVRATVEVRAVPFTVFAERLELWHRDVEWREWLDRMIPDWDAIDGYEQDPPPDQR